MQNREIYLDQLRPFIERPVIKVLTGIRRSGKSSLLQQIHKEISQKGKRVLVFVDMELSVNFPLRVPGAFERFLAAYRKKKTPKSIFIDEVQEIPEWERSVNALLKEGGWDIYLTGSNAHLLSSELATLIAGRYVEFQVYPLGYSEFLQFVGHSESSQQWDAFLRYGGFPGLHELPALERVRLQYLAAVQDTILLRDVVERNAIRDPKILESVIDFIYDNIGSFTTAKTMSEYLKSQHIGISIVALQGYLRALESGFAIHQAKRYDIKGKRLLEVNSKYYVADLGLRFARLGARDRDISGILENVVYLELCRRGYQVHVGRVGDLEVDFVALKEGQKLYVQVAATLHDRKTREREFRSLEMIQDNYPKMVLSLDSTHSNADGILQIPLREFLTQS